MFAPPADLADRALELFHDLVAELRAAGTLDPAYRRTIAHLARLEARAEQMRRSIGRRFVLRTAKDEETGRRGFAKNQALAQLSDLEAHLTRLYGILGLTPEGIVRAPKQKGEGDGGENPFAEFRS